MRLLAAALASILLGCGGSAFKAQDGVSTDGGDALDGGADGSSTDGASSGAYCRANPGHEACFDFEGTGFPPAPLKEWDPNGGGTIKRDTTVASSSQASLATSTPATGSTTKSAALDYAWPSTSKKYFSLSFDLYVDAKMDNGVAELSGVFISPGVGYYQVYFSLQGDQLQLTAFVTGSGEVNDGLGQIPLRTWKRIELTVDLRTNPPVAKTTKLDGTPVSRNLVTAPKTPYDVNALLGINYVAQNASAVNVHVDNVLIDSQ